MEMRGCVVLLLVGVMGVGASPNSAVAGQDDCDPPAPARAPAQVSALAPKTPPQLRPSTPKIDPIGCFRAYRHKGVVRPIDSYNRRDGENLRTVFEGVEPSIDELNRYQQNRRNAKIAAYVGSVGLAMMGASLVTSLLSRGATPNRISPILLYGGLATSVGGFGYGFAILRTNEKRIDRAVEKYNEAHPESPIELMFQTTFLF